MRRPLAFLLLVLCLLAACGGHHTRWLGLDTAQYHLQTGLLFLEREKPEDAQRELALAAELDTSCGLAYCNLAVACAQLGRFGEAKEHLAKARWLATDAEARYQTKVAGIRLLTAERSEGWLDEAQVLWVQARSLKSEDQAAPYYMALAHKAALQLERAQELLRGVALAGEPYGRRAAEEWRLLERARRAAPRTDLGRELAPHRSLTRAELAALLWGELGLGRPWSGGEGPPDLAGHRLRDQVLPVVALDIDPLRPYVDGSFHPDTPVSRAEFAQLVATILERWRWGKLQFSEPSDSPYPDLDSDAAGYRALTLCGSRGLLGVRDLFKGRLDPNGPLSGADALLAIGRLREQRGPI